jgi:hypothetical protein
MGAVFRSKDLSADWRKRAENAIKDLSPDTKDSVLKVLDSWEGVRSEEKLKGILGRDKTESLVKKIKASKSSLTNNEREEVQDMFRESLTFD